MADTLSLFSCDPHGRRQRPRVLARRAHALSRPRTPRSGAQTCVARYLARRGSGARRVDGARPRTGGVRAARGRPCRAPAPDLGVRQRRLALLGQLLVRGSLRARQLQPVVLPARRARGVPDGGGRRRRCGRRVVRVGRPSAVGAPRAPVRAAVRCLLARCADCRAVPVRARLRLRARGTRRVAARSPGPARPVLPHVAAREPARLLAARGHPRRADCSAEPTARAAPRE